MIDQSIATLSIPIYPCYYHLQSACPGPYWSLMFECSENKDFKPVDLTTIVEQTIQGAINTKMIASTDEIVSIYYRRSLT